MNCNLIGAGRLGMNIAFSLSGLNTIRFDYICNTSYTSALQSCEVLGFGLPVGTIKELPQSDVTWITCNDDSISQVVYDLGLLQNLKRGSFVIHCSGVLSSSILEPLRAQGCYVASFHPPKSFQAGKPEKNAFADLVCIVEGDQPACQWLQSTFTQLGAQLLTIEPNEKPAYHAAAVIASNYLVTLAHHSQQLLLQTGLHESEAKKIISQLMQSSLINLQQKEHIPEALTGPLARGDLRTISKHLQAIKSKEINDLYKSMAMATLPMTITSVDSISILFEQSADDL